MIRGIALALAVAAVSTSATAQTNKQTWQDLIKPYDAKTNPNVPLAPPQADVPAVPILAPVNTGLSTVQLYATNPSLLDGCVYRALGRTPMVEGARVARTEYKFSSSWRSLRDFWDILITVDFNGKPVHYRYTCEVWPTGAELTR